MGENVVQEPFQTRFLRRVGFAHVWFPQGVCFGELGGGFEGVGWEGVVDGGFGAAAVAGVDPDGFAEELWVFYV